MLGLLWGTLFSALALAIYLHFKKRSISNGEDEEIVTGAGDPILYAQFIKFKRSYLLVYLLVVCAVLAMYSLTLLDHRGLASRALSVHNIHSAWIFDRADFCLLLC